MLKGPRAFPDPSISQWKKMGFRLRQYTHEMNESEGSSLSHFLCLNGCPMLLEISTSKDGN
jgi:hypothetical protein